MFNKNLKFYRLKNNLSKRDLAAMVNVSPMAITNYENGSRRPKMEIIKALANALNVRVADFLANPSDNLVFRHGAFRKNSRLSKNGQELIKASVEEYFGRFFSVIEILGGGVLPEAPKINSIDMTGDIEKDAYALRKYLGIAELGPVGNLTGLMENKGILIYQYDIDSRDFSGMNGLVNGRPYIIVNKNMNPERIRSTMIHEAVHFAFKWPDGISDREEEKIVEGISGAFLFPAGDAVRELGVHRNAITNDMTGVCKEYGISMYMLTHRAQDCGIITASAAKDFYIHAGKMGWRANEPRRIEPEEPEFFSRLVYRAVNENEISAQKGAEFLHVPYEIVADKCYFKEGQS